MGGPAAAGRGAGDGAIANGPRGGALYWCSDAFDAFDVDGPFVVDETLAVEPRLLKKLLRALLPLASIPSVAKRSWCDGAAGFWRKRVPALCGRKRPFDDVGGDATPKKPPVSCDRRSPFIVGQ